jgi:cell division septum initiation protein DivIVA
MLESVAWGSLPLGDIGLVGVCAVLTLMLLRMVMSGKFIPRDQVDMLTADLRTQRAYYLSANDQLRDTNAELARQLGELTLRGDMSLHLLTSIRDHATQSESGSAHVASSNE